MPFYGHEVDRRSRVPQSDGKACGENAAGTAARFDCGSFVRVSLFVDAGSGEVGEAKFVSSGCGFMIAAADLLMESIKGQRLTSLHGLDTAEWVRKIAAGLDIIPADRSSCIAAAVDALRAATADHRDRVLEGYSGDKPLICTCFGVSEEKVEVFIRTARPAGVEEVTVATRAGGGCGSCRMLIQELIDVHEAEEIS
jgi:NifU-like protein